MGDRIVVMKDGFIQQVDDPITLYDNPKNKFVAGFIGSPPMNFLEGSIEEADGRMYFSDGKVRLEVAPAKAAALRAASGFDRTKVSMGIRPEDFYDPNFIRAREGEELRPITAEVEIIEPMGAESYLYLTTGKSPIVARVDSHVKAEVGAPKELMVNIGKAHFFAQGEMGLRIA